MRYNFVYAIILSVMASAGTGLGSLISIVRQPGGAFMGFSLGFSAGVMMFVSFAELLSTSMATVGFMPAVAAFFAGMGLMFIIDLLVPHEFISEHKMDTSGLCPETELSARGRRHRYGKEQALEPERLLRLGLLVAIGIGLHNFPEGMATFAGALKSLRLGIAIAVAIGLHNIPEGVAVGIPVYCATGSRKKALLWATISGAAELFGALVAAVILLPFLNETVLNILLAGVGGLMVYITFDELIPGSYAYGYEHMSVAGIILGMMVMAGSLFLFR